ncbi:MAG: hypothetical protein LBH75_06435 [Treponema sp.]|jgi:hypothetical protein|nr:hypothetical protein [Treponema sp.]
MITNLKVAEGFMATVGMKSISNWAKSLEITTKEAAVKQEVPFYLVNEKFKILLTVCIISNTTEIDAVLGELKKVCISGEYAKKRDVSFMAVCSFIENYDYDSAVQEMENFLGQLSAADTMSRINLCSNCKNMLDYSVFTIYH